MSAAFSSIVAQPAATLDLTVAGVRLEFRAPNGLTLGAPGFEYAAFLVRTDARRRIPVIVECDAPPAVPDSARLVCDTDDCWQLHSRGPQRWLRMPKRDAKGNIESVLWQVSWTEPLVEARLWATAEHIRHGTLQYVIQYPLDQLLLTHALLPEGGLLLHAAAAVFRSTGIAFAGVSGAGKSTITRLLRDADDLSFLSDDRVMTRPGARRHEMHGTPWAGDARVAEPVHTPLSAICFLHQSAAPALTPLAASEALERLLPVATLPWFDAAGIGDALEAAGNLVSQVPCYELAFDLDPGTTRALLDTLPHGH